MIDNTFIKTLTVILLIVSLLAGSCVPKSKTITPLSEADRTGIKKVAIHVQVNDELNADISNMKGRFWADMLDYEATSLGDVGVWGDASPILFLMFVAIVAIVIITEESIRSHTDKGRENEFNEDLSDIKIDKLMAERIDKYFETTDAPFEAEISEIQSPSILAQQGFDTILDITIEKIDVRLCPKRFVNLGYNTDPLVKNEYILFKRQKKDVLSSDDVEYSHAISRWNAIYPNYFWKTYTSANDFLYSADIRLSKKEAEEINRIAEEVEMLRPIIQEYISYSVRTWITFKGKIISTGDNRVLWDREELYYDPKCERVEEIQDNPEIIVDMLTRAIHDIAVNTVNEIQ